MDEINRGDIVRLVNNVPTFGRMKEYKLGQIFIVKGGVGHYGMTDIGHVSIGDGSSGYSPHRFMKIEEKDLTPMEKALYLSIYE